VHSRNPANAGSGSFLLAFSREAHSAPFEARAKSGESVPGPPGPWNWGGGIVAGDLEVIIVERPRKQAVTNRSGLAPPVSIRIDVLISRVSNRMRRAMAAAC
jgi:hypothetical protein